MKARCVFEENKIRLEIEERGRIKVLRLEEKQICWEGFRELRGGLVRGVPRRNGKDCLKYCRHEGCDFG